MSRVFSKSVKMLILTLASILVVSVSAATYYSLVMDPHVGIEGALIQFVAGDDSTNAGATGYSTDGTWVKFTSIKAYPNATLTYEEAINVSNTDSSNPHSVRFRPGSITNLNGSATSANFTKIAFVLIAQNGTVAISNFNYTGGGSWTPPSTTSYVPIPQSEEWTIRIETTATSGAMADVMVEIDIYIDVEE
ncbi:MAG: hypothetical protein JSV64_02510 [Candidatus Bathyarchaeota archaeon]|nr:MAG: hypothetical protein JSV64_02510 [Candidatus Bathyarchaeota archaeon]